MQTARLLDSYIAKVEQLQRELDRAQAQRDDALKRAERAERELDALLTEIEQEGGD